MSADNVFIMTLRCMEYTRKASPNVWIKIDKIRNAAPICNQGSLYYLIVYW